MATSETYYEQISREQIARFQGVEALNEMRDKIRYGLSSRYWYNMSFNWSEDPEEVRTNRRQFTEALGIDINNVVYMAPTHGTNIQRVGVADRGRGALDPHTAIEDTDALYTTDREVAMAINPADCPILFLTNPDASFLAVGHVGRAGTEAGMARLLVERVSNDLNIDPQDMIAGMGPGIHKECYRLDYIRTRDVGIWLPHLYTVGANNLPERGQRSPLLQTTLNGNQKGMVELRAANGKPMAVDLMGANTDQLVQVGLERSKISESLICSACFAEREELFSHQVTAKYANTPYAGDYPEGRNMVIAQLLP